MAIRVAQGKRLVGLEDPQSKLQAAKTCEKRSFF
jgi:hypothetical protein